MTMMMMEMALQTFDFFILFFFPLAAGCLASGPWPLKKHESNEVGDSLGDCKCVCVYSIKEPRRYPTPLLLRAGSIYKAKQAHYPSTQKHRRKTPYYTVHAREP